MFKQVALLVVAFSAFTFMAGAVVNADVIPITPTLTQFTTDTGSGISGTASYTHLLDFGAGASAAVVNTVQFEKISFKDVASKSGTSAQGYGYTYETDSFCLNTHSGGGTDIVGVPTESGMYTLLYDFMYAHGTHPYQKITLSDLNEGTTYVMRLYYRAWAAGTREVTVDFDYGNGNVYKTSTINEDGTVGAPPYYATMLSFEYTATAAESLVMTINHVVSGTGWHMYGLAHEEVVPEPSTLALLACGLIGLLAYAWRKQK